MGDELSNATYTDRLIVSSALSAPNFTLAGNDYFFELSSEVSVKMSVKNLTNGTFEPSRISW